MIPVTTIVSRVEAMLDAEGFDHYGFNEDFKPAINYAQEWLLQLYSRVLGGKKFSEENLRDLCYVRVWVTSDKSRINFVTSDLGGELWSILGVYPLPDVTGTPPTIIKGYSTFCPLLIFENADYSAQKTNQEKRIMSKGNPFMQGNDIITGDLQSYNYVPFMNYTSTISEIEINPRLENLYVAVAYLLQPTEITLTTDSVKFPKTLLPLIVNKTAQYISTKQGDRTSLYSVTEADIKSLIQLTI